MSRRMIGVGLLSVGVILTATACLGESGNATKTQGSQASSAVPVAPDSTSASNAQQPLPPNFHRVSDAKNSVSLGVPTDWTVIGVTAGDLEAGLDRAGINDPTVRAQVRQLQTLGAVFVADPASRSRSSINFLTNVNAFCSPSPSASIDTFKAAARQQLQQIGATNVQISDTTLDGRPAIRTNYVLRTAAGEVQGTQNGLLADGKACTITLSTDQPERYQQVFDEVTATIDIN